MQGCYEKKEILKIALVCYDGPYLAWCVRVSLFPLLVKHLGEISFCIWRALYIQENPY